MRQETRDFLDGLEASPPPALATLGAEGARAFFDQVVPQFDLPPADVPFDDRLIEGPDRSLPIRVYKPARPRGREVIVYAHGGGGVVGGFATHQALCSAISEATGRAVVMPAYRLAPEHPFPAGLNDVRAAAAWVAADPSVLDYAATSLVMAGDSAGGAIAAALTAEGGFALPIALQWLLYPVTDWRGADGSAPSMRTFGSGYGFDRADLDWYREQYLSGGDAESPHASPLTADSFAGLPQTHIVVAALDILRDQGRRYASSLVRDGVDVAFAELPDMPHGCLMMRRLFPSAEFSLVHLAASVGSALDAMEAR